MRQIVLCILLLSAIASQSQIIVEQTSHNLGEVGGKDGKYFDFKLTNASDAAITIDKFEEPYGTRIRFQNKSIQPDSVVLVRIKYTPKRKGEFSVDVPLWLSSNSSPIVLTLKGKAVSFNPNESMEPPKFEKNESSNTSHSQLLIQVVDKESGEPISNASIDVIWDGVIYEKLISNQKGLISKRLEDDSYYFIASAAGYSLTESTLELVGGDQTLRIEMNRTSNELVAEKLEPIIDTVATEVKQALQDEPEPEVKLQEDTIEAYVTAIDTVVKKLEVVKEESPVVQEEVPVLEEKPTMTSDKLPEDKYVSNNIVFLIDVSVSMRSQGKLDLLKASMIELASLLRPSDKLAIVTYSSKTNVAMHSTSASNKAEIISVIKNLEAGGKTAGAKGIKKAYKVLNSNRISDGNNQVFISTDGAFNLENKDKKLLREVKKNAKRGNKISVLGIKNKLWTVKNMEEIAKNGNGNYIHIENYNSAKNSLIEEVKKQSAIQQ